MWPCVKQSEDCYMITRPFVFALSLSLCLLVFSLYFSSFLFSVSYVSFLLSHARILTIFYSRLACTHTQTRTHISNERSLFETKQFVTSKTRVYFSPIQQGVCCFLVVVTVMEAAAAVTTVKKYKKQKLCLKWLVMVLSGS